LRRPTCSVLLSSCSRARRYSLPSLSVETLAGARDQRSSPDSERMSALGQRTKPLAVGPAASCMAVPAMDGTMAASHLTMRGQRATSTRPRSVRSVSRDRKLKESTLRFARDRSQPSAVGLDDRAADRLAHAHALGLGRVEWLEQTREALRAQPRAGVPHPDAQATFGRNGIDADL
jgi:hypothetical protein